MLGLLLLIGVVDGEGTDGTRVSGELTQSFLCHLLPELWDLKDSLCASLNCPSHGGEIWPGSWGSNEARANRMSIWPGCLAWLRQSIVYVDELWIRDCSVLLSFDIWKQVIMWNSEWTPPFFNVLSLKANFYSYLFNYWSLNHLYII